MRLLLIQLLIVAGGTFSGLAQAGEELTREKLKTGILPTGRLYSIYEVRCPDGSLGSVASLERQRRWCTSRQDTLACFRSPVEASQLACHAPALAEAGPQDLGELL